MTQERPLQNGIPKMMLWGLLCYGGASCFALIGLKLGGASAFSLSASIGPCILALTTTLFFKEKWHTSLFIKLGVTTIGILIMMLPSVANQTSSLKFSALLLISLAMLCEALGVVGSKLFRPYYSTIKFMGFAQLGCALFFWAIFIVKYAYIENKDLYQIITAGTWPSYMAILYVSIFALIVGYFLFYRAMDKTPGNILATVDGIQYGLGALWGQLFFAERPHSLAIMGCLIVLSGLFIKVPTSQKF